MLVVPSLFFSIIRIFWDDVRLTNYLVKNGGSTWKFERENKFRMNEFKAKGFAVKMFEELFQDPKRIYMGKNWLWCFVYTEYSFPLSLIENVDWFPLCSWSEAGEAATQLYWDAVAGSSLGQCWCSRKTSETDCRDFSRNFKHHHNLYFLSSLIQICMTSALNCDYIYFCLLAAMVLLLL